MIFSSLKNKPLFYVIIAGFIIMVFVELPLINNSLKGKEKDFNDKLFYIVALYEDSYVRDTSKMNEWKDDAAAIRISQTTMKKDIDSIFTKNEIPDNYVFAVGKARKETMVGTYGRITEADRSWQGNHLIWSSDTLYNKGLIGTKLRVSNIGSKGEDRYYIKLYFPFKPNYLFQELLPLIIISAITLVILFVCFLALVSIIRKQNLLAEIKNDFVNNITHELKTPLFTISIASKMLAEQDKIRENEKYNSYVESIQQEAGRLTKLVDKVLQVSALKKQQLQLDKKEMDVHAAIHSVIQNLELIITEQKATITIQLLADKHLIIADEAHFESVLFSMLDNAFKYSNGPAQITITTYNVKNQIAISIADKGIGLDIETKELIFERFFRANTGNLHNVKGYGIGLSYVKSIIEAHDGTITVNSSEGKGSEFIILIPVA